MHKIYSSIEPNTLLHIVYRLSDIKRNSDSRDNIIDEKEFLQLSALKMSEGDTFAPHKHIYKKGQDTVITQESWVVISGKVKFLPYDLDGTPMDPVILNEGDCSITLRGGHNYQALEPNTIVYEYKTGPYQGRLLDKKFLYE